MAARKKRPSLRGDDTAAAMQAARAAHARERIEDYVEAVDELIQRDGECRITALARWFGVSHVTAVRAVEVLKEQGLAETEPHRPVALTSAGTALARRLRERHDLVYRFLLALGVDPDTAALDTEGIEHHLSPETLRRIRAWLRTCEGA